MLKILFIFVAAHCIPKLPVYPKNPKLDGALVLYHKVSQYENYRDNSALKLPSFSRLQPVMVKFFRQMIRKAMMNFLMNLAPLL